VARHVAKPSFDPEAMLVFGALARTGGVRAAGAALGLPKSTVSRRLVQLEQQAGAALVVRTGRRFALTEAGTVLAARCAELEEVLHRAHDSLRDASREPAGLLRIEAAPVLGEVILPEVLLKLTARYPRLSVEVRMSVDFIDLRRSDVDVTMRAGRIEGAADLFAVLLGKSTKGCWASPAYARARGLPRTPKDLTKHECIVVGNAARPEWGFTVDGVERRVAIGGRVRVDSVRLARGLAMEGGGIVRGARALCDWFVKQGRLVPVLERYWTRTPLYAVHAGPNPPTPKVRAFIEIARDVVSRATRIV
jgi:DNA-binding transcriptional LysR family regulator